MHQHYVQSLLFDEVHRTSQKKEKKISEKNQNYVGARPVPLAYFLVRLTLTPIFFFPTDSL